MRSASIEKASEIRVVNDILYEQNRESTVEFGLLDEKLGPVLSGNKCKTCQHGQEHCPGHFGYIKLLFPVFHTGYFKQTTVVL